MYNQAMSSSVKQNEQDDVYTKVYEDGKLTTGKTQLFFYDYTINGAWLNKLTE